MLNYDIIQGCMLIFLNEDMVQEYYNVYCNGILWPMLHYKEPPQDADFGSLFNAYKQANQMFADVVSQHYRSGDLIWLQDYHLMWFPKCIRKDDTNINIKVGWFLHTPFPNM